MFFNLTPRRFSRVLIVSRTAAALVSANSNHAKSSAASTVQRTQYPRTPFSGPARPFSLLHAWASRPASLHVPGYQIPPLGERKRLPPSSATVEPPADGSRRSRLRSRRAPVRQGLWREELGYPCGRYLDGTGRSRRLGSMVSNRIVRSFVAANSNRSWKL